MGIQEKVNTILEKVGLKSTELIDTSKVVETVETVVDIEMDDVVDIDLVKEIIVEEAQIEAERIIESENDEIKKLSTTLDSLKLLMENQTKLIEEQKAEMEELKKKTPTATSINEIVEVPETNLTLAQKQAAFLKTLK